VAITIKAAAAAEDQRMTLAELREFLAECVRAEVPDDSWLEIDFTGITHAWLKTIEVKRR
jgi:hypothetical protein